MLKTVRNLPLGLKLLYAAIIIVALVVGWRAYASHSAMKNLKDTSQFSHFQGPENAERVIVEFLDYRCSYCRQMHPVMKEVMERHPDVKIVYRFYPVFGPPSILEANIALSAGAQGKFSQAHEFLITREEPVNEAELPMIARRLGLNVEDFTSLIRGPEIGYHLLFNVDSADLLDIRSTPTFIVGDILYRLSDELPTADTFDTLLKQAYGD